MAVELPPNSSGQTVDTFTTITGDKERQVTIRAFGGQFSLPNAPAAATQATVTQAAAGAGIKNVATKISFAIATGANAQTIININLRDGGTGAGTILWTKSIILPTTAFWSENVDLPEVAGSANTAMTLEFSGAGVSGSYQSVTLNGFTTA